MDQKTWVEHEEFDVDWWVEGDRSQSPRIHAATVDGLARGLAWAAGAWGRRWAVAAVLVEPQRIDEVLAESAYDGPVDGSAADLWAAR